MTYDDSVKSPIESNNLSAMQKKLQRQTRALLNVRGGGLGGNGLGGKGEGGVAVIARGGGIVL